jgi:molybdate transport system permease protein
VPGRGAGRTPLPWLGGLLALYLAIPVAAFVVRFAQNPKSGFAAPGLFPALYVSVVGASIALGIVAILGVPLAYVLARSHGRIASVVDVVVQIPLALPPLISGILLIYIIGPYTSLGRLFDGRLTESMAGVVIAMSFVSAPFLIVTARAAFEAVDQGLLDVASSLGHSDLARFWLVAIPVAGGGIRAGMLLAWLRAFGEYGAVVIVAYHPFTIPVYTYNAFSATGLPNTIAPTAICIAVAVAAVVVSRLHRRRRAVSPVALPEPATPAIARPMPASFDIDHRIGSFHLQLAHRAGGDHLAILGPSGSGKSALLRCVAGIYGPDPGPVAYGTRDVTALRTQYRRVGYVAQGFSLYPHLTVWDHLLFGVDASPSLATYWLSRLHLDGLEARYPSELSGGQRQRVSLAQALCRSPDILLLDEPLSALDTPVRRELRRELRNLQVATGLATVIVTHDPEEAAYLSNETIVMAAGRVLQTGATPAVFSEPNSPQVARLLGIPNPQRGVVTAPGLLEAEGFSLAVEAGDLAAGTPVLWSIRPDRVGVTLGSGVAGTVVDVIDTGTGIDLYVAVSPSVEIQARTSSDIGDLRVGQGVTLDLPRDALTVWPALDAPGDTGGPGDAPSLRAGGAR